MLKEFLEGFKGGINAISDLLKFSSLIVGVVLPGFILGCLVSFLLWGIPKW